MKVYFYCSYKSSPIGFKLGMIENKEGKFAKERLFSGNIDKDIEKMFEESFVRTFWGILPKNKTSYCFLIKNLKCKQKVIGEKETEIYMNVAFEFLDRESNFKLMRNILNLYNDERSNLEEKMGNLIKPDYNNKEFALSLDGYELDKFIEEIGEKKTKDTIFGVDFDKEKSYFILNSNINGKEKIRQNFFENDESVEIKNKCEKYKLFLVKKKKRQIHINLIVEIIVIILIIVATLSVVFKRFCNT